MTTPGGYLPRTSLPSGTPPEAAGDRTQVDEHVVLAVEGRIPANDLVWKCEYCDQRGTTTGVFDTFDCDRNSDR